MNVSHKTKRWVTPWDSIDLPLLHFCNIHTLHSLHIPAPSILHTRHLLAAFLHTRSCLQTFTLPWVRFTKACLISSHILWHLPIILAACYFDGICIAHKIVLLSEETPGIIRSTNSDPFLSSLQAAKCCNYHKRGHAWSNQSALSGHTVSIKQRLLWNHSSYIESEHYSICTSHTSWLPCPCRERSCRHDT